MTYETTTTTKKKTTLRLRSLLAALGACALVACGGDDDAAREQTPPPAAEQAQGQREMETGIASGAPIGGHMDVDEEWLESGRMDRSWRTAADSDRQMRRSATGAAGTSASAQPSAAAGSGGDAPVERMRARVTQDGAAPQGDAAAADGAASGQSAASESWESISPDAYADFAPTLPVPQEGGGPTVLALQWMLDRAAFSPGVIDGRWGKNTEKAVYWLQDALGLESTGEVDRRLWDLLAGQAGEGPLREHTVTAADLEGPFVDIPESPYEQAELDCMCHASAAEALAERFHTTPDLLSRLNPQVDLASVSAGTRLWVPAVEEVTPERGVADNVARIVINKDGFYLHALDDAGNVLYHFPTTVGASYDASPSGELDVTGIAYRPTYHYQPKVLSDVPDDEEDAMLPAGPNSPVGLVWMQLSKDTYGIHGTSAPATIGYATSHGCVRLTNWDALFLANRTAQGTPVEFTGG